MRALDAVRALTGAGDLKYIGEGLSERAAAGSAAHVRSIRGGGGAKTAAAAAKQRAPVQVTSPIASPPGNSGAGGAGIASPEPDDKGGFFSSLRNKLTFSRSSTGSTSAKTPVPSAAPAPGVDLFRAAEAGNVAELQRLVKAGGKVGTEDKVRDRCFLLGTAWNSTSCCRITMLCSKCCSLDAHHCCTQLAEASLLQ